MVYVSEFFVIYNIALLLVARLLDWFSNVFPRPRGSFLKAMIFTYSKYYLMLTTFLGEDTDNITDCMACTLLPFGNVVDVNKDHIYISLTTENKWWMDSQKSSWGFAPSHTCRQTLLKNVCGPFARWTIFWTHPSTIWCGSRNAYAQYICWTRIWILGWSPKVTWRLSAEAYVMCCLNTTYACLQGKEDDQISKARSRIDTVIQKPTWGNHCCTIGISAGKALTCRAATCKMLEWVCGADICYGVQRIVAVPQFHRLKASVSIGEARSFKSRYVSVQMCLSRNTVNFSCKQDNSSKRPDFTWQEHHCWWIKKCVTNLKWRERESSCSLGE